MTSPEHSSPTCAKAKVLHSASLDQRIMPNLRNALVKPSAPKLQKALNSLISKTVDTKDRMTCKLVPTHGNDWMRHTVSQKRYWRKVGDPLIAVLAKGGCCTHRQQPANWRKVDDALIAGLAKGYPTQVHHYHCMV
jgi:hypothetical protein